MRVHIPVFPLSILPLPGELVPLHIFEPRYKQLIHDAETLDICFGIYCTHRVNDEKIGSLMKLESIIKRYDDGRMDIIARCEDIFRLSMFWENYKDKLYPGGTVEYLKANETPIPDESLEELFRQFMSFQSISRVRASVGINEVANELNLSVSERYHFLTLPESRREEFLSNLLRLQIHVLNQEYKSREVFHLN